MSDHAEPRLTSVRLTQGWIKDAFSNSRAVLLIAFALLAFLTVYFLGDVLAPVFVSVVVAYLLEGLISILEKKRIARQAAVYLVFLGFFSLLILSLSALLPLLLGQVTDFLRDLPAMIAGIQEAVLRLPEVYPRLVSKEEVQEIVARIRTELFHGSQRIVSLSVISIVHVLTYSILVPFVVFFLLKDKHKIVGWVGRLFYTDQELFARTWRNVDRQLGNYMRGKFLEILIVWGSTALIFAILARISQG